MTEQENRKLNELSITLAKACKEDNNEVKMKPYQK